MRIFSFYFWFFQLPLWCFILLIMWFIPWVFLLYSGLLIYFPYKEDGKTRFIRMTGPLTKFATQSWTPIKQIPNVCKAAVVASEDSHFYEHNGVEMETIIKILKTNNKHKKNNRGGSTITQQLVKNAFLSREKNYLRKTREIAGAFILDAIMTKENQLEWYFNIIEFGSNTYGIEQAAQKYFKINAKNLSPAQCVALVTILPAPKKWNKTLENKEATPFFLLRYNRITNNMEKMRILSKKEILLAKSMNLGFKTSVSNKSFDDQIVKGELSDKNFNLIDEENDWEAD